MEDFPLMWMLSGAQLILPLGHNSVNAAAIPGLKVENSNPGSRDACQRTSLNHRTSFNCRCNNERRSFSAQRRLLIKHRRMMSIEVRLYATDMIPRTTVAIMTQ